MTERSAGKGPAPLIWIDMEMSGLDAETCTILEIATIVTEGDLSPVAEGPSIVIHHHSLPLGAIETSEGVGSSKSVYTDSMGLMENKTIVVLIFPQGILKLPWHHHTPRQKTGTYRSVIRRPFGSTARTLRKRFEDIQLLRVPHRRWGD